MGVLPEHLVRGRDYTYGHTVNESLAILREVDKMGLSIPLAISFSLKGVYYAPKFANPSSPNPNEFQLFKPCEDHSKPYYDDPHNLCKQTQGNWIPQKSLPVLAHNIDQKKAMTYLTEITVAQLACEGKVFNLKLNFALAAYDADFDQGAKCPRLGFDIFGGSYNRLLNMRKVMDFLRNSYTSAKDNFDCQSVAVNLPF
ncbi:hypothetical protein HPB52_004935 [Rhipicephalus sanguineus]|uniref:Uncharacterized protein n=1 Tax=Rhipicephalus sanguineus TaxID=34632 RepID=A0A9D4PGA4_RHISA|nr:hypothetical protein HPB52_004935 [Rhipicephalus sanguineus]